MDISEIAQRALGYMRSLDETKSRLAPKEFGWYPYGTLHNFPIIEKLLTGANRELLELGERAPVVDIGAADGDSAFFLEHLGCNAHIVDYAPTNFNGCRGAKLLKETLGSSVLIREVDLDAKFELPGERYGLALFLGILYHLKNPFGALESLARTSRHALISTRVARFNRSAALPGTDVNPSRVEIAKIPVGYLVDTYETSNDPTNYWMFSDAGLRRILNRTGWDILDYMTVGNRLDSDPASNDGDERAFCLVRSRF